MTLKLRPHHFLCTLGFQGKGYNDAFVKNYIELKQALTNNTQITVTNATDNICKACPHQRGELCETEEKIKSLDKRHEEKLGFHPGETLSWSTAKEKIKTLSISDFHQICATCSWKELGICEQALNELKRQ